MTQTSVGSSCMAQQLYFCVFHVMWCIQTERAEEPPAGCLKTLASPHKARPTELQHTLNLMAANMHIGIHLEPAAPDVNKQYNFTPLPPPPPLYSPLPILGLYSLHTVILVPNLLADSLPLRSVWRHALFSPLRWALSGDHLIREGLHEKDRKRGPQVENLPPMGISFILHMQMTLIKREKALPFAPVWHFCR